MFCVREKVVFEHFHNIVPLHTEKTLLFLKFERGADLSRWRLVKFYMYSQAIYSKLFLLQFLVCLWSQERLSKAIIVAKNIEKIQD